jgi:hypothetical protein
MTRVLDVPQTQWILLFRRLNGFAAGRPVRLEVFEVATLSSPSVTTPAR